MTSKIDWADKPVKYLRDKVVDQLKYNFVKENLEIEEYELMLKTAVNTNSKKELISLVADLPLETATDAQQSPRDIMRHEEKENHICIMSGVSRKGFWKPPKHMKVWALMGGANFDFRDAQFGTGITYISIGCLMGGVDIIVPPGVQVISKVIGIMGGTDNRSGSQITPESPTIVIEGIAIMGGVKIREKDHKQKVR